MESKSTDSLLSLSDVELDEEGEGIQEEQEVWVRFADEIDSPQAHPQVEDVIRVRGPVRRVRTYRIVRIISPWAISLHQL